MGFSPYLSIDLTAVHVFHRVFGLVSGLELDVGVSTTQMRVDVVLGEFHVLDDAVGAEDLHDVVLVDGAGQTADVDFGRAGSGGTAASFALVTARIL